jgi:transposase
MGSSSGRRIWSVEQKRRILAEAVMPGASVAEVARCHEVNANLLFKWLRRAGQGRQVKRTELVADDAGEPGEFVPLGVVTRDEVTGGAVLTLPAPGSLRPTAPAMPAPAVAKPEKRVGLIEIDLPSGGRVRVDAFVNERALGRVLRALKDLA